MSELKEYTLGSGHLHIQKYLCLKLRRVFMIAMLWANQIVLGKKTYAEVPRLLKAKVKELLIDAGYEELVVE